MILSNHQPAIENTAPAYSNIDVEPLTLDRIIWNGLVEIME